MHHTFLEAVAAWIKCYNGGDAGGIRLKAKKRLYQVQQSLELLQDDSQRFSAPNKEFVEEDKWDVKIDGKSNIENVVE